MNTHIDTLAEWWENAEEGEINEGDRLIYRDGNDYDFRTATRKDAGTGAEKEHEHGWGILSRASKPKPAWHDAVAVIAHTDSEVRQVWVREGSTWWAEGMGLDAYELRDVTPLIEAKVTGEMVERAAQSLEDAGWDTSDGSAELAAALTAALGLETALPLSVLAS